MLDVHFVFLGAAIGCIGQAIYVRDTIRGTTQPNRVTFILWAIAPLLAFAVELNEGVGLRSLMTFVIGAGPLVIFTASFVNRAAVWRIGRLDYACGFVSLLGTAGWLLSRHGTVALVAAIGADALAALPTILKSWKDPDSETALLYVTGVLNAGITVLTIQKLTLAVAAFPVYILVVGTLQIVLVAGRVGERSRLRSSA